MTLSSLETPQFFLFTVVEPLVDFRSGVAKPGCQFLLDLVWPVAAMCLKLVLEDYNLFSREPHLSLSPYLWLFGPQRSLMPKVELRWLASSSLFRCIGGEIGRTLVINFHCIIIGHLFDRWLFKYVAWKDINRRNIDETRHGRQGDWWLEKCKSFTCHVFCLYDLIFKAIWQRLAWCLQRVSVTQIAKNLTYIWTHRTIFLSKCHCRIYYKVF